MTGESAMSDASIRRTLTRPDTIEWILGLSAALLAAIVWFIASRDMWFFVDAWDFLTLREIGSVDEWLEPHNGHLQIPAFLLHRVLYGAVGMDYFPWYLIPHVLLFGAACVLLWRVLLARGTDRVPAFGALLLALFIGGAVIIDATVVGALISLAGLILLSAWFNGIGIPARHHRVWLMAALLVLVGSGSSGVIIAAAAGLVAAVSPAHRRWLPAFVLPAAAYVSWLLTWGADSGRNTIDLAAMVDIPLGLVETAGLAVGRILGFPDWFRWGFGVAVTGFVVWLAWRRRLRAGDVVFLVAAAGFVSAVLLVRASSGHGPEEGRYAVWVSLYLLGGFAPHIRLPSAPPLRTAAMAGVVGLAGFGVVVNALDRVEVQHERAEDIAGDRVGFDAVAAMSLNGEPMADQPVSHLGDYRWMIVRISAVGRLVEDGYRPPAAADSGVIEQLRPRVRFEVGPHGEPRGHPVIITTAEADGCITIEPGTVVEGVSRRRGSLGFNVLGEAGSVLELTWIDQFGSVVRVEPVDGTGRIRVPDPVEENTAVTIGVPAGSAAVRICGAATGSG